MQKLRKARDAKNYEAVAVSISSCTGDQYQVRKLVDAIDELSKSNL